jgi:hypothetical protein
VTTRAQAAIDTLGVVPAFSAIGCTRAALNAGRGADAAVEAIYKLGIDERWVWEVRNEVDAAQFSQILWSTGAQRSDFATGYSAGGTAPRSILRRSAAKLSA